MKGYYRREDKTKETLVDGYVRTGDIGVFLPDGRLKIVDRANNIGKLLLLFAIISWKIQAIVCSNAEIACFLWTSTNLEM
mgnify:CR=1 FL=1